MLREFVCAYDSLVTRERFLIVVCDRYTLTTRRAIACITVNYNELKLPQISLYSQPCRMSERSVFSNLL